MNNKKLLEVMHGLAEFHNAYRNREEELNELKKVKKEMQSKIVSLELDLDDLKHRSNPNTLSKSNIALLRTMIRLSMESGKIGVINLAKIDVERLEKIYEELFKLYD
jgi:hypothetical protein